MTNLISPGSTPVSALIGSPVVRVAENLSLRQVAEALMRADVGAVVVGDDMSASGVVSERDISRAVANGLDVDVIPAVDVAQSPLIWCDTTSTVAEVAAEMMEHWVRHVLVEQGGRLVGIVSARDLLGLYATEGADAEAAARLAILGSDSDVPAVIGPEAELLGGEPTTSNLRGNDADDPRFITRRPRCHSQVTASFGGGVVRTVGHVLRRTQDQHTPPAVGTLVEVLNLKPHAGVVGGQKGRAEVSPEHHDIAVEAIVHREHVGEIVNDHRQMAHLPGRESTHAVGWLNSSIRLPSASAESWSLTMGPSIGARRNVADISTEERGDGICRHRSCDRWDGVSGWSDRGRRGRFVVWRRPRRLRAVRR